MFGASVRTKNGGKSTARRKKKQNSWKRYLKLYLNTAYKPDILGEELLPKKRTPSQLHKRQTGAGALGVAAAPEEERGVVAEHADSVLHAPDVRCMVHGVRDGRGGDWRGGVG